MKKVILVVALCGVLFKISNCKAIITHDFYLYDREYATEHETCLILPNTLRITLNVGESYELFAEAEGEENFSWETGGAGVVELYPDAARCTVYGKGVGEDRVKISINGEDAVYVDISVSEPPKVVQRSFEIKEAERKKTLFSEKLMRFIINGLRTFSGIIIFAAVCLWIKKRRRK